MPWSSTGSVAVRARGQIHKPCTDFDCWDRLAGLAVVDQGWLIRDARGDDGYPAGAENKGENLGAGGGGGEGPHEDLLRMILTRGQRPDIRNDRHR